ncbi:unnamed protein product [Cladocopium goreaui]|uniref:Potassium voltage-gated channel subfamily A member 6 n=1 Tax=Cladocopium goreaui TaxID=2562237 RepID=A0A9P1BNB3_9DINO|nr:unnamed protein product [Cladocopium goreaui]
MAKFLSSVVPMPDSDHPEAASGSHSERPPEPKALQGCRPQAPDSAGEVTSFSDIEFRLDLLSEQVDACLSEIHLLGARSSPANPKSVRSTICSTVRSATSLRLSSYRFRGSELSAIIDIMSEKPLPEAATSHQLGRLSTNSVPSRTGKGDGQRNLRQSIMTNATNTTNVTNATGMTFADARRDILDMNGEAGSGRSRPQATVRKSNLDPQIPRKRGMPVRSVDLKVAWKASSDGKAPAEDLPGDVANPMMRLVQRNRFEKIWELLEDPYTSRAAWFISLFLKVATVLSVLTPNLQVFEDRVLGPDCAAVIETTFDTLYLLEFGARILVCPFRRAFLLDPYNWPDLLSATGLFFRASIGFVIQTPPSTSVEESIQVLLLFVLPVVRFLKLLRYFESFRLLVDACSNSLQSVPVLIYTMTLILLITANGIYLAEERNNIPSLAHSYWLAVVTMTSVGFGDYTPKTAWGFIIVGVLTLISTLFLAMPVGILGQEFSNSWERRNYVILIARLRKCLLKLGIGAKDLRVLFEYIDVDGDGIISFFEFIQLIHQLRLGFAIENAVEIFNLFDDDRNAQIDYIEFLRHIFPHESQEDKERTREVMHKSELRVSAALERLSDAKSSSHEGSGHLKIVQKL